MNAVERRDVRALIAQATTVDRVNQLLRCLGRRWPSPGDADALELTWFARRRRADLEEAVMTDGPNEGGSEGRATTPRTRPGSRADSDSA